MKIAIFGLGYVGCTMIACLARLGHRVIGVDINDTKVRRINEGKPTVFEPGLSDLLLEGVQQKRITATTNGQAAMEESDIIFLCVGTPNDVDGKLNLNQLFRVVESIGVHLRERKRHLVVAIRSTVSVGANSNITFYLEDVSGKKAGVDFGVVSNPEFLREGSAIEDYFSPPYSLIASECESSLDVMSELYVDIESETIVSEVRAAELIKYVNNSFHALKVSFGNELGRICEVLQVNTDELLSLFFRDEKLNISKTYLTPGPAYGGSCLPKDLKALLAEAAIHSVKTPVLSAVSQSNEYHKEFLVDEIKRLGKSKIGFLGIAFKSGTDDVRNSPAVDMCRLLLKDGFEVGFYDEYVTPALKSDRLIANSLEGCGVCYLTLDEILQSSDVLVLVNPMSEYIEFLIDNSLELEKKQVLSLHSLGERYSMDYTRII
jgi:GDP-mannose 6-dehydrogenase